jgi:hypothetical protein
LPANESSIPSCESLTPSMTSPADTVVRTRE